MKKFIGPFAAGMLTFICVVDRKFDDILTVEVTDHIGQNHEVEMNTFLIPCELNEGDMFYIVIAGGVTEIRCGEPEPK